METKKSSEFNSEATTQSVVSGMQINPKKEGKTLQMVSGVSSLAENDASYSSSMLKDSPKQNYFSGENADMFETGDDEKQIAGSKIEVKIRKLEARNKTKMLEKVMEETETHNGAMVAKYTLGNNQTKSRELKA